jgi:enolase
MKIQDIKAYEILDSRGNPTISATVTLDSGKTGTAAVPSGASTGRYEAVELRDGDKQRFGGQGVQTAISNIHNIIAPALMGLEADEQGKIDRIMIDLDGTENKAKLGANAILAVSLAVARAAASAKHQPLYRYLASFNPDFKGQFLLPVPMMNVLNGGKHADWATDIQEYMIMPVGAKTMAEAVRMGAETYQHLKKVLKARHYSIALGDEGGFAPAVSSNAEAFDLLVAAVEAAGYKLGTDIVFAIDAAASEFYENGAYVLKKEGKTVSGQELANFYNDLATKYPICSWEDVFSEDDWTSFSDFSAQHPKSQVVGDDLYVTNVKRLEQGISQKCSNAILIKLNQIGTLSETVSAVLLARQHGLASVISHRSGETEDTFIADLAVALGTGQIKTGAPARSERTAKYNRLMAIEAELGQEASILPFPFV